MRYVEGYAMRQLSQWKGKRWYHQRFDGSPYFLHYIAEAEIAVDRRKKRGADFSVHFCFFEDGRADWYILQEDIDRISRLITRLGKKNPAISRRLMSHWKRDEKQFYSLCKQVERTKLNTLSDQDLRRIHEVFLETVLHRNSSSSIIDGFALGTDEVLAEELRRAHERSPLKKSKKFAEVFSALTAPAHHSFINEAEIDLMVIAAAVKKQPRQRSTMVKRYQQKYFWLRNNYIDSYILEEAHFDGEVDRLLQAFQNPEAELSKLEQRPLEHKRIKDDLIRRLKLTPFQRLLVKISEDFTHWQDERKKASFWTTHYGTLLLKEFSRRLGLPLTELKYLSPRELSVSLSKAPPLAKLKERRRQSVAYWDENGHEILTGDTVVAIEKAVLGQTTHTAVDDFRGLVAMTGTAIGTVKIVRSAKETEKVKPGDILVAVMTRPDYVPAMKRAAAIVTDEGGVTCHAAIISREMGLPCIIGTKIATKVLKDGQKVEVRANHGFVRILPA